MVGAARAVAFVFLGGCALFEGPGDYSSHDAAAESGPAEAAADASDAGADAAGPPDAALCDSGPICQCLTKNCSKETNACLATAGCSCGLSCADKCVDPTCLSACFSAAGGEATDFIACYTINCIGSC